MVLAGEMPPKIQEQYTELRSRNDSPGRAECEQLYPELLNFIRERVSLVDLIRATDFTVELLSLDAPDIYVVREGCLQNVTRVRVGHKAVPGRCPGLDNRQKDGII